MQTSNAGLWMIMISLLVIIVVTTFVYTGKIDQLMITNHVQDYALKACGYNDLIFKGIDKENRTIRCQDGNRTIGFTYEIVDGEVWGEIK